jgi:hypothetical protein
VSIPEETKKRIDRWIRESGRNEYGDARGTFYTGGTPLFNERTGAMLDRYEYILSRHPELKEK